VPKNWLQNWLLYGKDVQRTAKIGQNNFWWFLEMMEKVVKCAINKQRKITFGKSFHIWRFSFKTVLPFHIYSR